MLLADALTEFFYAHDFTRQSERSAHTRLGIFAAWCAAEGIVEVEQLTTLVVRRYIVSLRTRISARSGQPITGVSQHQYASAVRNFLRWCAREGWINERVPARVEMPQQEKRIVPVFSQEQVKRILRAAEGTSTPARDKALLSVLFDTGIRVSEVCGLTLDAVHLLPNEAYLTIHGKGRKEREVPLGKAARLALLRYLSRSRPAARDEQRVFLGKGGALTPRGVDWILRHVCELAGKRHFAGIRISPHTCRHTFAVSYLDSGGDLYRLMRLMGHTNTNTTSRYLAALTARQARKEYISLLDAL